MAGSDGEVDEVKVEIADYTATSACTPTGPTVSLAPSNQDTLSRLRTDPDEDSGPRGQAVGIGTTEDAGEERPGSDKRVNVT